MARPVKARCICNNIKEYSLKPMGLNKRCYVKTVIKMEELEAMRLVDMEGMQQAQAAKLMKVSRQTLARIVEAGRKKATEASVTTSNVGASSTPNNSLTSFGANIHNRIAASNCAMITPTLPTTLQVIGTPANALR